MYYTIISKLPEINSEDNQHHFFAVDVKPFYYKTLEEAEKEKEVLDKDFPEWINEIVLLVER